MGDGMEALAIAIAIAALGIIVVPAGLFGALGYLATRKSGRGWLGALVGVLVGGSLGVVGSIATFMESTWDPPIDLVIQVPPGFRHEWVLLIEDPGSTTSIEWSGRDLPFTSRRATVAVPRSGVVRVSALGELDGGDVEARSSDGRPATGRCGLNAPPGVGSGRLVCVGFAGYPGTEPDIGMLDEAQLAARIAELSAEDR